MVETTTSLSFAALTFVNVGLALPKEPAAMPCRVFYLPCLSMLIAPTTKSPAPFRSGAVAEGDAQVPGRGPAGRLGGGGAGNRTPVQNSLRVFRHPGPEGPFSRQLLTCNLPRFPCQALCRGDANFVSEGRSAEVQRAEAPHARNPVLTC